jgi:hypothetical protein
MKQAAALKKSAPKSAVSDDGIFSTTMQPPYSLLKMSRFVAQPAASKKRKRVSRPSSQPKKTTAGGWCVRAAQRGLEQLGGRSEPLCTAFRVLLKEPSRQLKCSKGKIGDTKPVKGVYEKREYRRPGSGYDLPVRLKIGVARGGRRSTGPFEQSDLPLAGCMAAGWRC